MKLASTGIVGVVNTTSDSLKSTKLCHQSNAPNGTRLSLGVDDGDAESEPPPTPSSYGDLMASDDLMDVRDDDDTLVALTLSTVTPPQDNANANSNPNSSGNSHGHSNGSSNGNGKGKKRERKPRETRRLVRNGFPVSPLSANGTLLNNVPEQTEPEDLSMTSSGHLNTVTQT